MYDYLPRDLATLFAEAYIGESTPNGSLNPGVSPVFADLESMRGLPPLLIEAGGSEVLLRQIQRLAARAGRNIWTLRYTLLFLPKGNLGVGNPFLASEQAYL